jgi:hypothetical protein
VQDVELMAVPVRHARSLCVVAKGFFELNFPDYSWRTKFAVFECGKSKLPTPLRLRYVEELAEKEGLDRTQARWQFERATPHLDRIQ